MREDGEREQKGRQRCEEEGAGRDEENKVNRRHYVQTLEAWVWMP